jgi:hypothetical protein
MAKLPKKRRQGLIENQFYTYRKAFRPALEVPEAPEGVGTLIPKRTEEERFW